MNYASPIELDPAEARVEPKPASGRKLKVPDDMAMMRAAEELTADIAEARPGIYWTDMLGSALLGYAALAGTILAGNVWLALASGVVAVLLLYRALLFIHELTHVWQHQSGINLILRRHPFCRYAYALTPGKPLTRYGIEQQAMIVEDAFRLRHERAAPEMLARYEEVVSPLPLGERVGRG